MNDVPPSQILFSQSRTFPLVSRVVFLPNFRRRENIENRNNSS